MGLVGSRVGCLRALFLLCELVVVGVSRGTVVVMGLGVLLGIGDGAFNGVFHVKRGSLFGMIRWD